MAYMDQRQKAFLSPAIKAVLKKYSMKGTLGVRNHSTLVCNITSGPLDLISNMFDIAVAKPDSHYNRHPVKPLYMQVNEHWIAENYTGHCLAFLNELKDAMKGPDWFDKSDVQTDYFNISWYLDINVGCWNKPYQLKA